MDEIFLQEIDFEPDVEALAKRLRVRGDEFLAELAAYAAELRQIARPKGFYRAAWVEQRAAGSVIIDAVEFRSQVLCVNLGQVERVFPYLATCGVELAERRAQEEDILRQFWADAIMETALHTAVRTLLDDLSARFGVGKTAAMNPGSLKDWPLDQQAPFFELLGPGARQTGVVLTDSMLMQPAKSVSGLFFETESGFINCQLCPRRGCPNRRAEFDAALTRQSYGIS